MKKINDHKRINQAFLNSYNLIVSGKTLEDYLGDLEFNLVNLDIVFAHSPENPITKFEINFLLEHFEEQQDYEKCVVLNKILKDGVKNLPKRNK